MPFPSDVADYGFARARDLAFEAVSELWRRRLAEGWTQARLAQSLGRDRGWVSTNLRAPGNWTLRTLGELVQGLDGELDIQARPLEEPTHTGTNFDAYEGYLGDDLLDHTEVPYIYSFGSTSVGTFSISGSAPGDQNAEETP